MNISQAIILGVLQGFTEFLPVSSSAHLVFGQHFLQIAKPDIVFDVLLHFATLMAVVVFLFKDVIQAGQGFFRLSKFRDDLSARLCGLIILGSIPTALIGIIGKKFFEAAFSQPLLVAFFLLGTGIILWLASGFINSAQRGIASTGSKDALLIGLAQGIAILPGISRSGATISTGLMLGLEKKWSAKYSFLLSLPAVLGANILELKDIDFLQLLRYKEIYLAGIFFAFIAGLAALKSLLWILEKGRFRFFAYYCWLVGGGVIFVLLMKK